MRRGKDCHRVLQPDRHGLHRRGGARKQLQNDEDRDHQEAELPHRGRIGGEQNAHRGDGKGVNNSPRQKQNERAGNRDLEPQLHDQLHREDRRNQDHEPVRPNLREHDFARRHRHRQEMLDRPMLALANERGAGQNDREHGDVADDLHHRGEPFRLEIGVEHDAESEVDRLNFRSAQGCGGSCSACGVGLHHLVDDLLQVGPAIAGLRDRRRIHIDLDARIAVRDDVLGNFGEISITNT